MPARSQTAARNTRITADEDVAQREAADQAAADQAAAATNGDGEKEKRTYVRAAEIVKDIPLDVLVSERVPEDEWQSHPLTDGSAAPRSEQQQKIDAGFKALLDEWNEKGKPDARHSPRDRYAVLPEHVKGVKLMIGLAAKLYDSGFKFSPDAHDANGRTIVVYSPATKATRNRKKKGATVTDPADGPVSTNTPDAPPADPEADAPAE